VNEPTIADIVPFLTDRGRIEMDFAFASWRAARAEARVRELETSVDPEVDTTGQ
jgi:hypothetical protein